MAYPGMTFQGELNRGKGILEKRMVDKYKEIASELMNRIFATTPVLEGWLRGAWTASMDGPDFSNEGNRYTGGNQVSGSIPSGRASAQEVAELKSALESLKKISGKPWVVYFGNSKPYVLVIEDTGYSWEKAPAGMAQVSVDVIVAMFS